MLFVAPPSVSSLPNFFCQFVCFPLVVGKTGTNCLKALTYDFILASYDFILASFLPLLRSTSPYHKSQDSDKLPERIHRKLPIGFIVAIVTERFPKSPAGHLDIYLSTDAFFHHSIRSLESNHKTLNICIGT